jgi:hypothetical protein
MRPVLVVAARNLNGVAVQDEMLSVAAVQL